MASISERGGLLYFDFRYNGVRCREYTKLSDVPAHRRKMEAVLKRIEAEITLGTFDYAKYFPNSQMAVRLRESNGAALATDGPLFAEFAEQWKREKSVEWRKSYLAAVNSIFETHLIPYFGPHPMRGINREMVLTFRANLANPQLKGDFASKPLAPATVNRIMGILRQIFDEGVQRLGITNPCLSIKRLKLKKVDIEPFTLEEVRQILATIRADYRHYLTVRFFTGMRSGEAHGLKRKHLDFPRRQILIRETFSQGRTEYTKTDGSQREIDMSHTVFDALKAQLPEKGSPEDYVFSTRGGGPIDNKNFNDRVWLPLLRHLGFKARRPYQMRHTCATLWLAAGENPEWIARQLGHSTTEMLFRVYSRFVPNLTRRDGSAFERLLAAEGVASSAIPNQPIKESAHG